MAVTYTPSKSNYARGETVVVTLTPVTGWTPGDSIRIVMPDLELVGGPVGYLGTDPVSIPATVPADADLATTRFIFRNETLGENNAGPDFLVTEGADWHYADEADVQRLLGTLNLQIGGDLDSDGTIDAGLVQADGEWSDGYIDLELARNQITIPVDLDAADAHVVSTLEDISAHLVVWYIWHHRGLTDPRGIDPTAMAGIMQGYKAYADEQLAKLTAVLAAEDEDDDTISVGEFGSVPIVRTCTSSTDENSQ
jgi:hypothetical protein